MFSIEHLCMYSQKYIEKYWSPESPKLMLSTSFTNCSKCWYFIFVNVKWREIELPCKVKIICVGDGVLSGHLLVDIVGSMIFYIICCIDAHHNESLAGPKKKSSLVLLRPRVIASNDLEGLHRGLIVLPERAVTQPSIYLCLPSNPLGCPLEPEMKTLNHLQYEGRQAMVTCA